MPIAIPTQPKCRGFILASQHPTFPARQGVSDPYAIVPCPYEPSEATFAGKDSGKKQAHDCGRKGWCERHWCGKCKKDREAIEVQEPAAHDEGKKGQLGAVIA